MSIYDILVFVSFNCDIYRVIITSKVNLSNTFFVNFGVELIMYFFLNII